MEDDSSMCMSGKGVKEYSSLFLEGLPSAWFHQHGGSDKPLSEATKVSSLLWLISYLVNLLAS